MTKPIDITAAVDLVNNMVGLETVGVNCDGEEAEMPISPRVRAHFVAVLGSRCPMNLWSGSDGSVRGRLHAVGIKPFADYLRAVADVLDPVEADQ